MFNHARCAVQPEAGGPIGKATAYRQHARECQKLARHAQSEDQRLQLLAMAETWEALAIEREEMLSLV